MSNKTVLTAACVAAVSLASSGLAQVGTAYEQLASGSNDLSSLAYTLTPNASGGYDISPSGAFIPTFTNNLNLGDDEFADALPLGFTIDIPGAGMVSAIDVDSNGWCAPDGGFTTGDFSENASQMESEATRFALFWDDLSPNVAGGVYFDTSPGVAILTFSGVPQFSFSNPGGDSNTAQIQFHSTGVIVVAYGAVDPSVDCIAGFSIGNSAPAQQIDLTVDLPFSTTSFTLATTTPFRRGMPSSGVGHASTSSWRPGRMTCPTWRSH